MWRMLRKNLPELDKDDLLDLVGLEERRTASDKMVPALALFGAGVLVGVGLGLMLAPKPGPELRADLKSRLTKANGSTAEKPAAGSTTAATRG